MQTGVLEAGGRPPIERPGPLLPLDGAQPGQPWEAVGAHLGSLDFTADLPVVERPLGAYAPPAAAFEAPPAAEAGPQQVRRWRTADSIASLRLARQAAQEEATQILEERVTLLVGGNEAAVPLDVDVLSAAARVREAERRYGKDTSEYRTARHGLVVDSRRYLGEWHRRLSWEYFPKVEQPYDDEIGSHTFMGYPLMDMVRAGLTPSVEDEETDRRGNEFVEEATYGAARRLGRTALSQLVARPAGAEGSHTPQVDIVTINECPDWAIESYKLDPKGGHGGYVPEKNKLMIRGVSLGESRFQDQVAVSGEHITHEVIVEWLRREAVIGRGENPTKTEVQAMQLLNTEGKGAMDVLGGLDKVASEMSGKRIFMGEVVPDDHPCDYEAAMQEAQEREAQLYGQAEELTEFTLMLERSGTDHAAAQGIVDRHVKKMIFDTVKNDPERTAIAFDAETGDAVRTAAALRAAGDDVTAQKTEAVALEQAPSGGCGAGSCGLKEAESKDEADKVREEAGGEAGDEVLRDEERCCPDCGETTLWYVWNSDKVITICRNPDCGAKNVSYKKPN